MDSLFEGMVLFNPSQLASDQDQQNHHQEQQQQDHHQEQQQQQQDHQDNHHDPINPPPPIPIDAPTTTADSESTTSSLNSNSHSTSQPLDENLFSDLTIVAPLETLPPSQNSSSTPSISITTTTRAIPSISRQVSRKKKRAGLRIGYGRDGSRDAYSHFSPSDLESDSHSIQSDALDDLPHTEDHNFVSSTPTKIDDDDDDNQTTTQVQQEKQHEEKEEVQEEQQEEAKEGESLKLVFAAFATVKKNPLPICSFSALLPELVGMSHH